MADRVAILVNEEAVHYKSSGAMSQAPKLGRYSLFCPHADRLSGPLADPRWSFPLPIFLVLDDQGRHWSRKRSHQPSRTIRLAQPSSMLDGRPDSMPRRSTAESTKINICSKLQAAAWLSTTTTMMAGSISFW